MLSRKQGNKETRKQWNKGTRKQQCSFVSLFSCSHGQKGFVLITVTIVTFLFVSLGVLFANFSTADVRIARAHSATTQAYYIDEAATALLKHKIKSDITLRDNFINGTLNENNSTLTLSNILQTNDHADVYAESTGQGSAKIIVKSNSPLGNTSATRTTKTDIHRALGDALVDYTMLTSGLYSRITFRMDTTFNNGIVFSSKDACIYNNTTVTVNNGNFWVQDRISKSTDSELIVTGGTIQEHMNALTLPAVDFNSANPKSWKNQATTIMTSSQFNNLSNGATLNGIIFVEGSQYLRKNLTVHGLLIINGNFEIEKTGNLNIIANGGPSGLLVKQTIEIEAHTSIEGLVYAGKKFEIEYDSDDTPGSLNVSVNGGVMSSEVLINRDIPGPANITITHNGELIGRVMNAEFNNDSPTIDVGHWEEEY